MTKHSRILNSRRVWNTVCLAVNKFSRINGAQSAAAFAHYSFFSLFPLIVLIVTMASVFIDREQASEAVIIYIESYAPITGEMQRYIFGTISGVINARGQAGIIALLMLSWAAMGFFATLIRTTNQAWGAETANWWRLPFKSVGFLIILVSLVLLGVALPVLVKMAQNWLFPLHDFSAWVYSFGSYFVASLVVFFSLSLFYRLAPSRPTRFAEVWIATLCATGLLQAAESLFLIYLEDFATLNAVYGAFGGIMALMLWIYLSGCIFIFGACLCAAQAESRVVLKKGLVQEHQ